MQVNSYLPTTVDPCRTAHRDIFSHYYTALTYSTLNHRPIGGGNYPYVPMLLRVLVGNDSV